MPERRFLKLPFWYYLKKKTTILYACILFERLIDAPPSNSNNTMTKPYLEQLIWKFVFKNRNLLIDIMFIMKVSLTKNVLNVFIETMLQAL